MIRRRPRYTRTDSLFPYTSRFRSVLDGLLKEPEVQLTFDAPADRRAVEHPVGLRTRGADGRTLARVEDAELDAGFISCASHRSEEHTSELVSLMRISYAVFCLQKKRKRV